MEEDTFYENLGDDGEVLNAYDSSHLNHGSDSTILASWGSLDEEIYQANSDSEIYSSSIYDSDDDNYFEDGPDVYWTE
jgi:hypothetical protein